MKAEAATWLSIILLTENNKNTDFMVTNLTKLVMNRIHTSGILCQMSKSTQVLV